MRTAIVLYVMLTMIGCACAQPKYMGVSAERVYVSHAPPAPLAEVVPYR